MSEQEESVPISKPATKQAQQSHPVFYVYIAIFEEPMTLESFANIMPGGWFLYLKMKPKATFASIMKNCAGNILYAIVRAMNSDQA